MCSDPQTKDGLTFACRRCNDCIAVRRADWVARAMAEKTLHPYALAVALTYDDSTEANRDAARMFQYADVRDFLKRVRSALHFERPGAKLRFLCAGEQGDRYGRCHWHLILFSDLDLLTLGELKNAFGKRPASRDDCMTIGKRKRRLDWSLWGKGFVTFQEPDQGGMAYVLSYCLKDQFTFEKSKGTMREAKSENFATGLFRMSKRPAIGEGFLLRKLETLRELRAVVPSLQIKIPDMSGYWHPNGATREKLLWHMLALNTMIRHETGHDAPQWATLVASLSPSDLEKIHGQESEETTLENELAFKGREIGGLQAHAATRKTCGAHLPCDGCLAVLTDSELATLGVERYADGNLNAYRSAAGQVYTVQARQREALGRANPYCARRGSKALRHAFPNSGHAPSGFAAPAGNRPQGR